MDSEEEKYMMLQRLLVTFMSEYTEKPLEELEAEFEKWADNKTEKELSVMLGDIVEVKKIYKDSETKESFYSEEEILRSVFEDDENKP